MSYNCWSDQSGWNFSSISQIALCSLVNMLCMRLRPIHQLLLKPLEEVKDSFLHKEQSFYYQPVTMKLGNEMPSDRTPKVALLDGLQLTWEREEKRPAKNL